MALAISTPVAVWNLVTGGGGNDDPTGASASITPDVDGVIAVGVSCDSATGFNPTVSVSDSVDGTTGWVAGPYRCDSEGNEGVVQLFSKKFTDTTARTITVNVTNTGASGVARDSGRAYAWKFTGQDLTTWVGAVAENSTTTNNWTPAGPTTTRANSIIVVAASEWEALGAMASSDLTETGFNITSILSGLFGYKSVASAGATTINLDAGSTGAPKTNFVAMEILEASGGGGGGSELLPKLMAHGPFIGSAA